MDYFTARILSNAVLLIAFCVMAKMLGVKYRYPIAGWFVGFLITLI